jgi:hypothetical protein
MEIFIVGVAPGVRRGLCLARKIASIVAVVAGMLLASARTARADSITVNSGQLTIGNGHVALDLFAPGVSVKTSYATDNAPVLEQWFIGTCSPTCAPGAAIPLTSNYMFVGYGSISANGTVFDPVRAQIQLVFEPPTTIVAPPFSGSAAHVSAPFTLVDGFFGSGISSFSTGVTPAYTAGLLGDGRVEFDLLPTSSDLFTLGPSVTFDFGNSSPTPEPASVILLATGLLGAVARRFTMGVRRPT